MEGAPRVDKHLLLREGEKDRHERVVLTRSMTTPTEHVETPTPRRPESRATGSMAKFVSADPDHPWSLRTKEGQKVCDLPCAQDLSRASQLRLRDERNTERTLDLEDVSSAMKEHGWASGDAVTAMVQQPSWPLPIVLLVSGVVGGIVTATLTLGPLANALTNANNSPSFNGAYAATNIIGSLSVMSFTTGMFLAIDNALAGPRVAYAINGREILTVGSSGGTGATVAIVVGASFLVASAITFGVAGSQLGQAPTAGCSAICGSNTAFRTLDFATALADASVPLFILGIQRKVQGGSGHASTEAAVHIMPTPFGIVGSF
jgi:hypothetical protein